jgi:hypothetical protein
MVCWCWWGYGEVFGGLGLGWTFWDVGDFILILVWKIFSQVLNKD